MNKQENLETKTKNVDDSNNLNCKHENFNFDNNLECYRSNHFEIVFTIRRAEAHVALARG